MAEPMLRDYPEGITAIDTGLERPEMAAAYLLHHGDKAAFIETGTGHTPPRLLQALEAKGIARTQVRYVIVTHVHLDHAGGAGLLMEALPNAEMVVHPRGAPHVIDPSKLLAGAGAVYGEQALRQQFGDVRPVPESRVIQVEDGSELALGTRRLHFLDTPGHAKHHLCVWDPYSGGIFTGDTFGLSYRELDTDEGPFIFPTTTPVHFDPDAMHASIARLMSLEPDRAFLTHYGMVEQPQRLAEPLHSRIDTLVDLANAYARHGNERHQALYEEMMSWLIARLREHGCMLPRASLEELLATDVELNVQGLEVWLDRAR